MKIIIFKFYNKDTLDANVRQELERSLKAYEIEFENKSKITAKINVEEKYSEKYKFVKFLGNYYFYNKLLILL